VRAIRHQQPGLAGRCKTVAPTSKSLCRNDLRRKSLAPCADGKPSVRNSRWP